MGGLPNMAFSTASSVCCGALFANNCWESRRYFAVWELEDEGVPTYDVDSDDEAFLDKYNKSASAKLKLDTVVFERIMDRVEMARGVGETFSSPIGSELGACIGMFSR
jgi:hypothetical protein